MSKRKAYRPRPLVANPLTMHRPASKTDADRMLLRFYTALEHMERGEHPGPIEWRDLSDALNIVETLALRMNRLSRDEVMPIVNAAIAAMVGAARSHEAGQGARIDAAGARAVRDVLEIYGQCLEELPSFDMASAHALTQTRKRAHYRRPNPAYTVVSL